MPRHKKATLSGVWWRSFFDSIRFCYRCGEKLVRLYVPEEKKRRHVCTVCKTITYLNPKVVAGLIPVLPNGQTVLLKRNIEPALGRWSYPAGFQELGESVIQAAERETWEEIKVRVKVTKLVGIYAYPDAGVVTIVYEGRVLKNQKPQPGIEAKEVAIFAKNKIPWKKLAFRSTTEALEDWMGSLRRKI